MPILSDIDILVNGGLELEEVEIEIKATDEAFVPTTEGKGRFYSGARYRINKAHFM